MLIQSRTIIRNKICCGNLRKKTGCKNWTKQEIRLQGQSQLDTWLLTAIFALQLTAWNSVYGDCHDDSKSHDKSAIFWYCRPSPICRHTGQMTSLMTGHLTLLKSVHKWLTSNFLIIRWISVTYCEKRHKSEFMRYVQGLATSCKQQSCHYWCIFKMLFSCIKSKQIRVSAMRYDWHA